MALTNHYTDLMNDTAEQVYCLNESKRTQIEQDGYMLRYAQRMARNIYLIQQRKKKPDLEEYARELLAEMIPFKIETKKTIKTLKAAYQIKKDLNNADKFIPAKMLLYAIEYGSNRKFAKHLGVPSQTIDKIINNYKKEVIECLKSES
jgi:thioredoxin reductase